MSCDVVRESFFGQLVYHATGRRKFRYEEDMPDFVLPAKYAHLLRKERHSETSSRSDGSTLAAEPSARGGPERPVDERSQANTAGDETPDRRDSATFDEEQSRNSYSMKPIATGVVDPEKGTFAEIQARKVEEEQRNPYIVDWYSDNDQENPRNWSLAKRSFVTFDICLLTFSIYIGSAIYAPGIVDITEKFGISSVAASLGITMFVLGYGIGPMFLSPLSEIPQLGRTSVYILSLLVFVLLQIPTALSKNLGALLPLRFLAGFVGSPALATGGASLVDMWTDEWRAVVIGLWGLAAVSGPVLGPVVGGFAVQAEGWTWTIWILLWLSGATFVFLTFFLPETSSSALLYRRAARLRRITGDPRFKSMGEIEGENMTVGEIAQMTIVRPFVLCFREPIVAFWNVYIALVYGVLYIFIESFNVVFVEMHGFNIAENGLAFLGLIVGVCLTYAIFVVYAVRVLKPMFANGPEHFVPEERLPVAMVGGILLPISLFMFGWTSSPSIPWIVPIIASAFFASGTFLLFQAGLNYLPDCYPRYVASILAGNDLFRSSVGAAFPIFSTAFFHNLGVGPACSILGGISILMLPFPFLLYKYGARIRRYSKFAN
ncbi:MFS general substrate transporter [Trametopsis cervina]|nr:MFS general substrate transporter [Trametopsis cervina]